eukprot:scaffold34043_cov26-Tisochrysis_lutea.AAC.3
MREAASTESEASLQVIGPTGRKCCFRCKNGRVIDGEGIKHRHFPRLGDVQRERVGCRRCTAGSLARDGTIARDVGWNECKVAESALDTQPGLSECRESSAVDGDHADASDRRPLGRCAINGQDDGLAR